MDNAADPPDAGADAADTQSLKLALTVISIAVLTFLSQTFTGRRCKKHSFGQQKPSAIPKRAM